MMKKRLFVLLFCAALLLSLCGCQEKMQQAFENTGLQEPAQAMIDGLLADDYETCKGLLVPQLHEEFTPEVYANLRAALDGVEEGYLLTPVYANTKMSDGVTQTSLRFELSSGGGIWQIQAVKTSDTQGLAGFSAAPYVKTTATGEFDTLANCDMVQWTFLIIALAELGFVLWMLIDCCRHKMENKWMWLALILMGNGIVSLTLQDSGMNLNFNVGIFLSYTALLRYSTGAVVARLFLPIGTVVYAAMRKKLIAPAEAPAAENTEES